MANRIRKLYFSILILLATLMIPVVVIAAGKEIIILHTNDIHCGITDNLCIDKVSQYKKDLKKQGHPVALVDAGDAIQGAPLGKLSTGESIIKIMNAVGESVSGRLHTLILRGDTREILARLQELEPLYMDALPLSLEEIFIYELGGNDYAVKDILL